MEPLLTAPMQPRVSSREVQRACYQSRYCSQLTSALSRCESVGLSLLGRSATAGVPWATRKYRGIHRVREEVRCSLWKFNHQAHRRECCEESQTVCRRKWWSFSTPYLIGTKTCHVIFIKDCYE